MSELQVKNEQNSQARLLMLRETSANFDAHILHGLPAPYRMLFGKQLCSIVAGPSGSLLYAMVRIAVCGSRESHRRRANRLLLQDEKVQKHIQERFLQPDQALLVRPGKNPNIINVTTGSIIEKLEWHHSPNHIMALSLIPRSVHRIAGLHAAGRGAYSMFSIKIAKRQDL